MNEKKRKTKPTTEIKKIKSESNAKLVTSKTEMINRFFKNNNYIIVVVLILLFTINKCDNNSYKEDTIRELRRNSQFLLKNMQTIGFISATGMLATVDRKPISYSDSRIQNAIVNEISQPFLQGAEQIKSGKSFSTVTQMTKDNQPFNNFYSIYVGSKAKEKVSFVLKNIFESLSSFYYPEYITVKKRKLLSFSTVESMEERGVFSFSFVVKYSIRTKNWIVQLNKWVNQDTSFVMRFKGIINPSKFASADNLLGIKIIDIEIPLLQKPNISGGTIQ